MKAPKRGQDLRLDMPAIGPKTIEARRRRICAASRSLRAGCSFVERERCAREADAAGLFVPGFAL